jgi:LacI family transcriptional regulator
MHGQPFSSDSDTRWASILVTARKLGLEVHEESMSISPKTHNLLRSAIQAFASSSSGAGTLSPCSASTMSRRWAVSARYTRPGFEFPRVFRSSVSTISNPRPSRFPSLTTIRQPFQKIGRTTALLLLLKKLAGETTPDLVQVEPELVVRESTATATRTPPRLQGTKN